MQNDQLIEWNSLVYLVRDVYGATKRLKLGEPAEIGNRMRKTAVSMTAMVNASPKGMRENDLSKIYPILSAISILETYLLIAKKNKLIRNCDGLERRLAEVKDSLYRLLGNK